MGLVFNPRDRFSFSKISLATQQAKEYIKERKLGLMPSALTELRQLNEHLLDGIPWNRILSIAGGSSSGKSSILEQIKYNIIDSDSTVECLSFEFEMSGADQVLRYLARTTGVGIKTLKSARGYVITEEEEALVEEELEKLSNKNVHYLDISVTHEEIERKILEFVAVNELDVLKKKLLITLDYAGLTKTMGHEDKRVMLDNLFEMFVRVKKLLIAQGVPVIIIPLLQQNRNAMTVERLKNENFHYPDAADIAGSSTPFNSSDIVVFAMNPSKLRGIEYYGPNKKPIKDFRTGRPFIYFHVLKNRDGDTAMLEFIADFARYRLYDAF